VSVTVFRCDWHDVTAEAEVMNVQFRWGFWA
jgi:hypothetical protein